MRRLEVAIPGLREKLAPDVDLRLEKGSFSRSTGHNILGRVEMLEDALELLLTAQVLASFLNTGTVYLDSCKGCVNKLHGSSMPMAAVYVT